MGRRREKNIKRKKRRKRTFFFWFRKFLTQQNFALFVLTQFLLQVMIFSISSLSAPSFSRVFLSCHPAQLFTHLNVQIQPKEFPSSLLFHQDGFTACIATRDVGLTGEDDAGPLSSEEVGSTVTAYWQDDGEWFPAKVRNLGPPKDDGYQEACGEEALC